MGFDDGKYYQNCNLICVAPNGYDGKSVSITDGSKSYSGTISNNIAAFVLPGRTQYTVKLMNASSVAYQTTVELGYGECVELHLETGYENVIKRELMSLEAISAATGDLTKVAPQADAVKVLNNNLGGLKFGKDGDGNYGYYGADGSLIPFNGLNPEHYINPSLLTQENIVWYTSKPADFEGGYYIKDGYCYCDFLMTPNSNQLFYIKDLYAKRQSGNKDTTYMLAQCNPSDYPNFCAVYNNSSRAGRQADFQIYAVESKKLHWFGCFPIE